jgi:hypothetical protein
MTNWLELTTDEMLNHLREVFTDYKIEPVRGKWTKFEVRKRDLDVYDHVFKSISVYTYSEDPIDGEKCKWYFSFYNMYHKESKETPIEIGISEYYKYLYEKLMEQEELTRQLTIDIININKEEGKSIIRDWKLNNLGV